MSKETEIANLIAELARHFQRVIMTHDGTESYVVAVTMVIGDEWIPRAIEGLQNLQKRHAH